MGCNGCRQSMPEAFNLWTERIQETDKPDEGQVAVAKSGNFSMVRLSFKCSLHQTKNLM